MGFVKQRLIPEWRDAWKFSSVQIAAALTALSLLQAEVLPLIQFAVPAKYWPWISAGLGLAIIVARLCRQAALEREGAPK